VNISVIGYGYWGSKHVRVLSAMPDVNVAVVDGNRDRLTQASEAFSNVTTFESVGDALEFSDAVVIATPPLTHATLAQQALEAGVHVMVEKPMAHSSETAATLVDTAERNGLVLMVGHTFEYNAAVWRLREAIVSGELGDVFYIDSSRLNLGLYQSDVNVLWDLAPHDVSIANYLLGSSPTAVSAWGTAHASGDLTDVAHMRLDYTDLNVTAYIHVSWLDPTKVRRVTVAGSAKMAVYDDLAGDERLRIYDKGYDRPPEFTDFSEYLTIRQGDIHIPHLVMNEPLAVEIRHFLDCIRTGATPRTDGESALRVVRVLEAADLSLKRDGGPIEIEHD